MIAQRLKDEYNVTCLLEPVNVNTARWVMGEKAEVEKSATKVRENVAYDAANLLVYIALKRVVLSLIEEHWPSLQLVVTREH